VGLRLSIAELHLRYDRLRKLLESIETLRPDTARGIDNQNQVEL
jgi:hypothetical protein